VPGDRDERHRGRGGDVRPSHGTHLSRPDIKRQLAYTRYIEAQQQKAVD
jgi:hypothetical protein